MSSITREQIIHIVGTLDDARIVEIITSGATEPELLEALEWVNQEDDYLGAEMKKALTGRVAQLYDILSADLPEEEER